jgi:hypothetical protein
MMPPSRSKKVNVGGRYGEQTHFTASIAELAQETDTRGRPIALLDQATLQSSAFSESDTAQGYLEFWHRRILRSFRSSVKMWKKRMAGVCYWKVTPELPQLHGIEENGSLALPAEVTCSHLETVWQFSTTTSAPKSIC